VHTDFFFGNKRTDLLIGNTALYTCNDCRQALIGRHLIAEPRRGEWTQEMKMKIGFVALAAILAAAPAFAASGDNAFSKDTSVDGQQRLAIRMDQAATSVCGDGMSSVHLALGAQARACHAEVIADIRSRIATATASADSGKVIQLALR
jgi:UrcA family protein